MNEGTPATSAAQLRAQVSKALLYMKPTVLENPVAGMLQKMCTCALMKGGYTITQKGKYKIVLLLNYSAKKDVRIISLHPVCVATCKYAASSTDTVVHP